MTTLYRTPNLVIDSFEWHAVVLLNSGRISLGYRWRPLSLRQYQWSSLGQWQGPKPKDFCNRFWAYRGHIRTAMLSEELRRLAVARLKGPPTGATVRNGQERRRGGRAKTILRPGAGVAA